VEKERGRVEIFRNPGGISEYPKELPFLLYIRNPEGKSVKGMESATGGLSGRGRSVRGLRRGLVLPASGIYQRGVKASKGKKIIPATTGGK